MFSSILLVSLTMAGAAEPSNRPFLFDEMTADQLREAVATCPLAFIPAGILEWHGEQSACGLDALKAETLCRMAAERYGGVCFPTVWLGPDASTPFDPEKYPRGTVTVDAKDYYDAATQILAGIEKMGFRAAIWLSGHYPGTIPQVAEAFNRRNGMRVVTVSENQVVEGMPAGDHAGAWETSLLMVLRPELVDMNRLPALPTTTRPATEPIPPPVPFQPRCEFYGIYAADPRVWASEEYGRRGTEAVLAGLASRGRELLGDTEFGSKSRPMIWPASVRGIGQARYDHLLPYQWLERFSRMPVAYWPLAASGESTARAVEAAENLAKRHGGMVFPALAYGPREDGQGVAMSPDIFARLVEHEVADLDEMGFRVVVLLPGNRLHEAVRSRIGPLVSARGQCRVLMDTGEASPRQIDEAIAATVCRSAIAASRILAGPWQVNANRIIAALDEQEYGPGGPPGQEPVSVYEHKFTLSAQEAGSSVMLDLGKVENHAEVLVNDAPSITDHWPPHHVLVTDRMKVGENRLRIVVRHRPQPKLDPFYYRVAPPRLRGPVRLYCWEAKRAER